MRISEIFRDAVRSNAAAIIVAHHHPVAEDISATPALPQAGKLLSIELSDHIIIVHNGYTSLKERGLGFE
jgi:DNA repair protein RadC